MFVEGVYGGGGTSSIGVDCCCCTDWDGPGRQLCRLAEEDDAIDWIDGLEELDVILDEAANVCQYT